MAKPNDATVLLGLGAAVIVGLSVAGIMHWWLVDVQRQTRAQRFMRRWLASFLAYFAGFCVLTWVAGPRALGQMRPRFAFPGWTPSEEPLSWGLAVGLALTVSLFVALGLTFWSAEPRDRDSRVRDA
jgi:uncharacterized BrkB/YihY/UPF0761 family membrane protein